MPSYDKNSLLYPLLSNNSNEDRSFRKRRLRFERLSSFAKPLTERELLYSLFRQDYKEIKEYETKNKNGRNIECFYKGGRNKHYIIITGTGENALIQFERAGEIAGRIFEQRQTELRQAERRKTKPAVIDERIDLTGGGNQTERGNSMDGSEQTSEINQNSFDEPIADKYFVLAVCFAETDANAREIFRNYLPFGATYLNDRGSIKMRPLIYDKKNGRFIYNNYFRRFYFSHYNKVRKVIINNIIGKDSVKKGIEEYKPVF